MQKIRGYAYKTTQILAYNITLEQQTLNHIKQHYLGFDVLPHLKSKLIAGEIMSNFVGKRLLIFYVFFSFT